MMKKIISNLLYRYNSRYAYNLMDLPLGAELNINDLIECSKENDPKPKGQIWLPSDRYSRKISADGNLSIVVSSKYDYTPLNKDDLPVSFLPSRREYDLKEGELRFRIKKEVNLLGLISTLISTVAITFTFLTFRAQEYEKNLARYPVWLVSYVKKENSLSFKSPSAEIQLLQGYFKLGAGDDNGYYLYMPDMKVSLDKFTERMKKMYSNIPRENDPMVFGENRIFDIFAIATRYTYKGEERYLGAVYKLFIDAYVPSKNDKSAVEVIIRGASFHRFFSEEEGIGSALDNYYTKEPTMSDEWIRLIGDYRKSKDPKKSTQQ